MIVNLEKTHNYPERQAFLFNSISNDRILYYDIKPDVALNWDFKTTYDALKDLIGEKLLQDIFNGKEIKGPHSKEINGEWLKQSKIIGINLRALGSYFDIVKYAMTFPEDSIHLLPLFEQGCQGSLYSPINFKLSEEFMDDDLSALGYDSPEKQLKLSINLLHALGKNVGMDVLQHTDRFSQEVFIHPDFFNWAKLNSSKTKELEYPEVEPDKICDEVKSCIIDFLRKNGDFKGDKISEMTLLNLYSLKEEKIEEILFGIGNLENRNKRRIALIDYIRSFGFEPKPVEIEDINRKITFKKIEGSKTANWATFSDGVDDKIFGSLTPYKLYHLDKSGNIDISEPNYPVWEFICKKYGDFQQEYNFDFLRADMGYLYYNDYDMDIHSKIKEYIRNNGAQYFASMGENFKHQGNFNDYVIQRKAYDAVLGNLQYESVYQPNFCDIVKWYNFTSGYKTCITSITADADQIPYNQNYDNFQNIIRTFFGFFLNQPSYMGMGLETRDVNPKEAKNLTKDFINDWGIKKYEWGKNDFFFNVISKMRKIFSQIKRQIQEECHYWLKTNDKQVASWLYYDKNNFTPSYIFIANASPKQKDEVEIENIFDTSFADKIDKKTNSFAMKEILSTEKEETMVEYIIFRGKRYRVRNLKGGECRIYKVIQNSK